MCTLGFRFVRCNLRRARRGCGAMTASVRILLITCNDLKEHQRYLEAKEPKCYPKAYFKFHLTKHFLKFV